VDQEAVEDWEEQVVTHRRLVHKVNIVHLMEDVTHCLRHHQNNVQLVPIVHQTANVIQ
jgi:hypothetical protein